VTSSLSLPPLRRVDTRADGCDPNARPCPGTPLTVAMANRHQPVIEALEAVLKNRGGDNLNHAIQTEKAYDGPSIDNVDVAVRELPIRFSIVLVFQRLLLTDLVLALRDQALLNIHGDEADASGPMKLDKPEVTTISDPERRDRQQMHLHDS